MPLRDQSDFDTRAVELLERALDICMPEGCPSSYLDELQSDIYVLLEDHRREVILNAA